MRSSWLLASAICFVVGISLIFTIIFSILGMALLIVSFFLFFLGLIVPKEKPAKVEVHTHIHNHRK